MDQNEDVVLPEVFNRMSNTQDDGGPTAQSGKATEAALVKLTDFAIAVFGDASRSFGTLIADQIGYWRLRNLLRISQKWEEELQSRGLSPKSETLRPLSFSQAYRITDAASLEEEDEIQEMWANLIASLLDPSKDISLKKYLVDILKSLETPDAALIMVLLAERGPWDIADYQTGPGTGRPEKVQLLREKYWLKFDQKTRSASIKNLFRLGCIQHIELPTFDISQKSPKLGAAYEMPEVSEAELTKTVGQILWLLDVIQSRAGQIHDRDEHYRDELIEILNAGPVSGSKLGDSITSSIHGSTAPFRLTKLGADLAVSCYGEQIKFEKYL